MFQPPIHSFCKILGIIVTEKISVRQGKIPRCTAWGISDQGNLAAGDGLQTGDGFDLNLRRMYVEVCVVDYFDKFLPAKNLMIGA